MEDVRDLKELQLDALKEVANIGAGHAATALSQLTSRTIMINVPEVNVRPLEEVPDLLGRADEVIAAVLMHMMGDLTGRTPDRPRDAHRRSPQLGAPSTHGLVLTRGHKTLT